MKLIDKDRVAAELEKRRKSNSKNKLNLAAAFEGNYLLSFLDTLEVKEADEEYNGKSMLYVLEKGVKQGKRELIDKACKWLRKELVNFEDYSGMGEELISDFRKAMEE